MMTRRLFLAVSAAGLAAASGMFRQSAASRAGETFEVTHTEEEWRKLLAPDQYAVLREAATERAFTSPLLDEHRRGNFACAGCGLDLFSSTTKFDSGTGWPSFWAPLDNAVGTTEDTSYGMIRTRFIAGDAAVTWVMSSMIDPADRLALLHEWHCLEIQTSDLFVEIHLLRYQERP